MYDMLFMCKNLRNAQMKRNRLRDEFLKESSKVNKPV